MRIAVDMDEVLADAFAGELEWLQREYGHHLPPELTSGRALEELIPEEHYRRLQEIQIEGSFFADLMVIEGSQQGMRDLMKKHEVFIATAAMDFPGSFAAKFRWLARHFPFISPSRIVFCGDKSILSADYLIDDNVGNFGRFRGQGILFSAPHNLKVVGYPRVNEWAEVSQMFLFSPVLRG